MKNVIGRFHAAAAAVELNIRRFRRLYEQGEAGRARLRESYSRWLECRCEQFAAAYIGAIDEHNLDLAAT